MARHKSVTQLEKQLQYAQARKNFTPPAKEEGATTTKSRKTSPRRYRVLTHPGTEPIYYTVRASIAAMEFFGDLTGAAVGLQQPQGDNNLPRHFRPAKIHAVKAQTEGKIVHAKASTRPYKSYIQGTGQASFSCPISSAEGVTGVVTLVKTLYTEKEEVIGPYGRIYYTPEYFIINS